MKSAPREPSPFERFNAAVRKVLSVPKATVEAKEAALRAERSRSRKKKRAVTVR